MVCSWSFLLALAVSAESNEQPCLAKKQIEAADTFSRGDSGFGLAKMAQYARHLGTEMESLAKLDPGIVVYCTEESHVQSAVRFASRCGYKVTVRSGGHSYTASSSCNVDNCMQLDLTGMNHTSVDGNIITTDPGNTLMVLANGSIGEFHQNDQNDTVYKSVLSSAPGSWGIITEFKMNGVPDSEVLNTRVLYTRILYSRQNFVTAWKHAQFVAMDQETKNLRDMKMLVVVGPPSDSPWTDASDSYIAIICLWTGVDSGRMNEEWKDLYWAPLMKLDHRPFPETYDIPAPMSVATRMLAFDYKNNDDRYAVQAMHSDQWWSDEFTELMADEMDERMALMPDMYPSWQFLPLGSNSQWARNVGMNSITWRDTRAYVDDWMFTKNESRYDEMVTRMVNFREKTRRFWQYSDGSDRSTWMSPATTYKDSTDLRIPAVAKQYFPDDSQFDQLQLLKAELDPNDLFSNIGTIPLRANMQHVVVSSSSSSSSSTCIECKEFSWLVLSLTWMYLQRIA